MKSLLRKKWEYYTGKMDSETLESLGWEPFQLNILKADIDKYLDSDKELSVLRMQISFHQGEGFLPRVGGQDHEQSTVEHPKCH